MVALMRDPSGEQVQVPCRGCGRYIIVPGGPVRAAIRHGRRYVTFCSRRCQQIFVAKEGAAQQEEKLREHLDRS